MSTTTTKPTYLVPKDQMKNRTKNTFKTNHNSLTSQISSKNHSGHRHVNQLMPESSSTNKSGTMPAQAESSTIVIPKTTIGRIIERKGNKINKI